jgi:hypothetical protein
MGISWAYINTYNGYVYIYIYGHSQNYIRPPKLHIPNFGVSKFPSFALEWENMYNYLRRTRNNLHII